MYPRFVEVHIRENAVISINIDSIELFDDQGIRTCGMEKNRIITVLESYDELKKLIVDAGCCITKRDPRLSDKPLTMEEMTRVEMVGEPVWNSNTRRWMLLIDSANDNTWLDLINHAGGRERWTAHDLRKYPLYRMVK